MRVDGNAFRKAREEIRKNSRRTRGVRGEPAKGTQEWLANIATIRNVEGEQTPLSVRTIQYLERGTASIQTVDAVSPHLGLNGRSLILDYGQDAVRIDAPGVIDLRPENSPYTYPDTFQDSALLLSVDPLIIKLNLDEMDLARLEQITATLQVDKATTVFRWLYRVLLTPKGSGWLGVEEEIYPLSITSELYRISLMFRQTTCPPWSWAEFVKILEETESKLARITLNLEFTYFTKTLDVGITVSQLQTYFRLGRQKRKSEWPFMAQPDALTWTIT